MGRSSKEVLSNEMYQKPPIPPLLPCAISSTNQQIVKTSPTPSKASTPPPPRQTTSPPYPPNSSSTSKTAATRTFTPASSSSSSAAATSSCAVKSTPLLPSATSSPSRWPRPCLSCATTWPACSRPRAGTRLLLRPVARRRRLGWARIIRIVAFPRDLRRRGRRVVSRERGEGMGFGRQPDYGSSYEGRDF